ncbi:MAG: hypothetical protein HZA90_23365 [Verrucomicrobia bacterium]|nr:hypothetical protein [Verrucomicrobiota bacterium]
MKPIPTTFGIPDTLRPLSRRDLRSCYVFACMGLFVLLLGLFPNLRPPPRAALPLAICFLALPAWGCFRFLTGKSRVDVQKREERASGTRMQVGLYTLVMVGVGIGFFLWARHLRVASPVILGGLLLIEGLGGVIVSLTEWWRLSHLGVSLGLMAGGFLIPFVDTTSVAVPVGGAFLSGSLVSAAILHWQLPRRNSVVTIEPPSV